MRVVALVGLLAATTPALSQSAQPSASQPTLPGGATQLSERHGDWTVACVISKQGETSTKICTVSQTQTNAQNQTVMSVELRAGDKEDIIDGVALLPFGLAVNQAVALALDDKPQPETLSFSTCLPQGCLVPLAFSGKQTASLITAKAANFTAPVIEGQPVKLTVSLQGLKGALERARELSK